MKECEQFRKRTEKQPDYPGREYELCTGESHGGPPVPIKWANRWRAGKGLEELPPKPITITIGNPPPNQPVKTAKPRAIPKAGVGTELRRIFESLGIKLPGCEGCKGTLSKMNAAGVDGCRAQRDVFLAEIRSRSSALSASQWAVAAAKSLTTGLAFVVNPLDPLPGLYDEAVRRADENSA